MKISICKRCAEDRHWKTIGGTKFQRCDTCGDLWQCHTQPKRKLKTLGIVDNHGCSIGGSIIGLENFSRSNPPKLDVITHLSLSKEEVKCLIKRLEEWVKTGKFKE